MERYVKKILNARVYDVAIESPLDEAPGLSERLLNKVLLKREDLQPVFSFKLRGAYNKISQLPTEVLNKGIMAASAGNHAQGVALAASRLGVKATIVMPKTTPAIKVEAVRRRGARTLQFGDSYDEAAAHAKKLAKERGKTYIPPYDDTEVIAGQGTVGMEILRQYSGKIDAIFVPVGGGGLIAGVAAYVKYLRPEIKVIGVEPVDAACLAAALKAGKRVKLKQVGLFADGVAVAQIGAEPFRIAKKWVDEVITVTTDEICAAIKDVFDDTRSIAEPAGALAVAGLKKYVAREKATNQTLVAIDSGANMNFDRLRHVAERAELGESREALLAVTIPERPGSFLQFCNVIGRRGITEFNYRYRDADNAHVFVGIELAGGKEERGEIIETLKADDYPVVDITDNEMAKMHVRYMVGGHADAVENEIVFRFQFPERPGALLRFLTKLAKGWNISMFHYRNHGSAYGRVLVALQVPPKDHERFTQYLDKLGYSYWDERDNPVYDLFL